MVVEKIVKLTVMLLLNMLKMSKHALLKNKNKQKYFAGGQDLINQIIDYFFSKFRIFKNQSRNLRILKYVQY